jgi:hypothetical protein
VDDTEESKCKISEKLLSKDIERSDKRLGLSYDEFDQSSQQDTNTGSFNDLSKQYKASGDIKEYVKLRRSNPDTLIEIATSLSLEWVIANEEVLKAHSIEPQIVAGALDADPACISELSLLLLERLIEREALTQSGETHIQSRGKAISDSLVNYLIAMMLDALDWNDQLYISRDLIVLIKHMIGANKSHEAKSMQSYSSKQEALFLAVQLRRRGDDVSMRSIAKLMGVNVSTVSRWFPGGEFDIEVERFLKLFEKGLFD